MKKIAIAGASVALAAMPVVGVFAATGDPISTDSVTDTLNITVQPTCTMTAAHSVPSGNTGSWTSTDATTPKAGTFAATISADTIVNLGMTTFTVICNDTTGWAVTVQPNDLTGSGYGTNEKFANTGEGVAISDTSADGTPGQYSFTTAASDSAITGYGINKGVSSNTFTGDGKTFTSTYAVRANSKTQPAKVYSGTVVYTLASNTKEQ